MTQSAIFTFKDTVPKAKVAESAAEVEKAGGTITHRYYESSTAVINGFSAIVPNPEALSGFKSSFAGDLDYIEEDGTVTTQ